MQASNPAAAPSNTRSPRSIAAQIAALQAELANAEASTSAVPSAKEIQDARVLVQHSPSPKKKKARTEALRPVERTAPFDLSTAALPRAQAIPNVDLLTERKPEKPSALLHSLSTRRNKLKDAEDRRGLERSNGFSSVATAPLPARAALLEPEVDDEAERDESLAIIERLEMGPKEFNAPIDDPDWEKVEPNSKIRLRQRLLSHEDVQEHLSQRYHISPSLLYSIVRPGRSGSELEVPVDGDFIIIGVLAEKSEIRMSAMPPTLNKAKETKQKGKQKQVDREDADELEDSEPDEEEAKVEKRQPKRFIIFKLLDMRLKRGQTTAAGDGVLTMFLFEANSSTALYDVEQEEVSTTSTGARVRGEASEQKKTTVYKGGSGGAYERFCKESNGTVVAILNPRVLKPRQPGKAHPTSNTLAITPESADSVIILGRAQDLGSCEALKKDGKPCASWCDRRINNFCDYHIQNAVQKKRSGRSELMIGTSSLTQSVGARGGKQFGTRGQHLGASADYDPSKKTGLLPKSGRISVQGVTTYVTGGTSKTMRNRPNINTAGFAVPSEAKEREDARDRKRRREVEEKVLMNVLKKDGGKTLGAKYLKSTGSMKEGARDADLEEELEAKPANRPFNAASLRAIGFDPTKNDTSISHGDEDEVSKKRRLDIVSALDIGTSKAKPKLGFAPAPKKSNVDSDEDELVVLREGELQPPSRAKVVWQMHAKRFAPKNLPTSVSAPLDLEANAQPDASTTKVPTPAVVAQAANKRKRKKANAKQFKSGTEGETAAGDLSQLMNNFKKAAQ